MKPSEVLRPLFEASLAACFSEANPQSEYAKACRAQISTEHAFFDDHAERLRAVEAYLTEHATGKARSTKYGIAEAARTYLSTLKPASEPAETWPRFARSGKGIVYVYKKDGTQRIYTMNGTHDASHHEKVFGEVTITRDDAVARFPAIAKDFPLIPPAEWGSDVVRAWQFGSEQWQLRGDQIEHRFCGQNVTPWTPAQRPAEWLNIHAEVIYTRPPAPSIAPANGVEDAEKLAKRFATQGLENTIHFRTHGGLIQSVLGGVCEGSLNAIRDAFMTHLTAYAANATAKLRAEKEAEIAQLEDRMKNNWAEANKQRSRAEAAERERDEWMARAMANTAMCTRCGNVIPQHKMRDHCFTCPNHPMRAVEKERDSLRAKLAKVAEDIK